MAEITMPNLEVYAVISLGSVGSHEVVRVFTDVLEAEGHLKWQKINPFCRSVKLVKVSVVIGETLRDEEGEGAKYDRQLKEQEE